jgi:hypothetical protein
MTDLSVSDPSELEVLIAGFADTYENYPFSDGALRANVRSIKEALAGDNDAWKTGWDAIYEDLEQIKLRSGGEIRAQATTLMGLIKDQCLVEE